MGDTRDFCALLEIAAFLSRVYVANSTIVRVRSCAQKKLFRKLILPAMPHF